MRIIPVLDVKGGLAVHAVAGDRADYRPLRSILHDRPDPLALARACRDRLGAAELYLADLDAIAGARPEAELVGAIARLGLTPWVDAGVRVAADLADRRPSASAEMEPGVTVLGLETLAGPAALRAITTGTRADRLAFSLDLRDGRPILAPGADWGTTDPLLLARRAWEAGITRIIVLDLARVGTGRGAGTLELLRALRAGRADLELIAGGGVAGGADLQALEAAGADAALVGSALHDGRLDLRSPTG